MDILRLRPIIRHVRVILRCDNYRQGKFVKFIKSKFKTLTCVVLLRRLNTMRGISAAKYDKGNMNTMMREIWVRDLYCYQLYIYCISLASPCYNQKHNQLFRHLIFAFKICLIRFSYFHVGAKTPPKCFIRGARYGNSPRIRTWIFQFSLNRFLYKWYLKQI